MNAKESDCKEKTLVFSLQYDKQLPPQDISSKNEKLYGLLSLRTFPHLWKSLWKVFSKTTKNACLIF